MANEIDSTGIHTQTLPEIVAELTASYQAIYGSDIDLSQNTPDGQRVNIEAQSKIDTLGLTVQVYNSFDVDTVIGVNQDRLYKINGVYRKSALFSYVQVNVTTTKAVTLQGLDGNVNVLDATSYAVSDTSGNIFYLVNSTVISAAGTYLLDFRAADYGALQVAANTITNMVTVQAGISGVNNPAVQYITGTQEESDEAFRIRRNKSTAIAGQGWYDSLRGSLLAVPLVTDVGLYVNNGSSVDSDGIPAHSIWAIVEGGLNTDIANVLYSQLTIGAGMKGDTTVNVIRADGGVFVAQFDRPVSQTLYIQMTVTSKTGATPDTTFIKESLVANLEFDIYEGISNSQITCEVININNDLYVDSCQISNNGTTWVDYLLPSSKKNFFALSTSNINITVT